MSAAGSNITSFANDTMVFATTNPSDCDDLKYDLDIIYLWSSYNKMMRNQKKFQYIRYHMGIQVKLRTFVYLLTTTFYTNLVK